MNPEVMKSFRFFLKDPRGLLKLAILCGVCLIPVVGWIPAVGYCIVLYRNIIEEKPEDHLLPEWEELGDYFFKGLSMCAGFFAYAVVIAIVGGIAAFVAGVPKVLLNGGESSFFGTMFSIVCAAAVGFAALWVLGSVFAGFSQSLEIDSCWQFSDIFSRAAGLGKDYFMLSAVIDVGLVISCGISTIFPNIIFWPFWMASWAVLFVMFVYGLAVLMEEEFHPILKDPSNIHIDRRDWDREAEEDEYGNLKSGSHKASRIYDRRPDTSLTWSTDSDEAEG